MKLVLDTNVFVSAFLWGGKPKEVLLRIIAGEDELFISEDLLTELKAVLRRPKFRLNDEFIDVFLEELGNVSKKILMKGKPRKLSRDAGDDKVLACALAAGADYIVTGDDDLLVLKKIRAIPIVSPSAYLEMTR